MSVFIFFAFLGFGLQMRNALEQRKRIRFLAHFLKNYRIESLMAPSGGAILEKPAFGRPSIINRRFSA